MHGYLNDFKDYLIDVKKTSSNTVDAYIRDISQFLFYCEQNGYNDVVLVDRTLIDQYIGHLKDIGKSEASKTRVIASVKCYFKFLYYNNKTKSNPAEDLKNPRIPKKLPGILESKDIMLLLSQPDSSDFKSVRDLAMIELLYATGIRVSELIEITVNDINTQIGFLKLKGNKSERIVPIYQKAAKHIAEYISTARPAIICGSNEDKLFINMNGQPLTRQGCWKIIKYYAEKAGIAGEITPKTLRHSFATHLLENGAQIKDVKEMLGHSDISSTQVYANIIKSRYMKSYEKFHPLADK